MNPGALRGIAVRTFTVGALAFGVWMAREFLLAEPAREQRAAQRVRLLDAPRPLPPPKVEKAPVEIAPAKREVELPPEAAPPTPGGPAEELLGVDAQGTGGADGFGLVGRPGGRDITSLAPQTGLAIGGGQDAAARWRRYGALLSRHLEAFARSQAPLRDMEFQVVMRLWLTPEGTVRRVEVDTSEGAPALDALLRQLIAALPPVGEGPPVDMPQPIRVRVTSR